jgi:hypothetical protein
MGSLIELGPALLLAVQLPLAAAPPAPESSALEPFSALRRCSSTRQQQACLDADVALKTLIQQQTAEQQRRQHPRCFGALNHLETVLAAFRWGLETDTNLQQRIAAAEQQCPAGSATVGQ